jgi:hypothetical protein
MRRGNGISDRRNPRILSISRFHRLGVLVELHHVLDDRSRLLHRQRLEVRDERAGRGQVGFGLRVEAAMNRVVGTLEQQRLAILHQFNAADSVLGIEVASATFARHHHRRGNVVLGLHLVGGMKVRPQLVNAPRPIADRSPRADNCRPTSGYRTLSSWPRKPLIRSTVKCPLPVRRPIPVR